MTLDVPSEYEEILKRVVASGAFANEAEALRHALELLAGEQQHVTSELPLRIDIDKIAAEQGVVTFDSKLRSPTIWPDDESTEDFLAFLRQSRHEGNRAEATN